MVADQEGTFAAASATGKNIPKTRGPLISLLNNMKPMFPGAGSIPIGPKGIVSVKNLVCMETVSTPRQSQRQHNESVGNPESPDSELGKDNILSFQSSHPKFDRKAPPPNNHDMEDEPNGCVTSSDNSS